MFERNLRGDSNVRMLEKIVDSNIRMFEVIVDSNVRMLERLNFSRGMHAEIEDSNVRMLEKIVDSNVRMLERNWDDRMEWILAIKRNRRGRGW